MHRLRVCPACKKAHAPEYKCGSAAYAKRESARRRKRQREKGAETQHWRRVVAKTAKRPGARCARCGTPHDLTAHYPGDHSTAKARDVVVLCRRCHGRQDGSRRLEKPKGKFKFPARNLK